MRLTARLLGATLLACLATTASAKTLVFCSEGSPEGFDPALYTAGTTFDASSSRSSTGSSNSSAARRTSSRASPKAGTSRRTGSNTPSTSARA